MYVCVRVHVCALIYIHAWHIQMYNVHVYVACLYIPVYECTYKNLQNKYIHVDTKIYISTYHMYIEESQEFIEMRCSLIVDILQRHPPKLLDNK